MFTYVFVLYSSVYILHLFLMGTQSGLYDSLPPPPQPHNCPLRYGRLRVWYDWSRFTWRVSFYCTLGFRNGVSQILGCDILTTARHFLFDTKC